jgi:hypothetical protein
MDTPHVRVFLSADLVGSTRLKNRLNHQELYEKFQARMKVVERLRSQKADLDLADSIARAAVLESLGISTEDFDWAKVIQAFYRDFHSEFSHALHDLREKYDKIGIDCQPWKAIGDELIYQFPVTSRRHLHWLITAFLTGLRTIDRKLTTTEQNSQRGLRLKGSAWVAGFPVRNRAIELPGSKGQEDFLGPDIDTGFRLGKCTRSGMLVVSVELAELLSEAPGDLNPIIGKRVGWEQLKGVWNDLAYPIIWVDLPSGYGDDDLRAKPFDDWEKLSCPLSAAWASGEPKTPLRDFAAFLRDLRNALPTSLGLVDPYILADDEVTDQMPDAHGEIRRLQKRVEEYQANVTKQGTDDEDSDKRNTVDQDLENQVKELLAADDEKTAPFQIGE